MTNNNLPASKLHFFRYLTIFIIGLILILGIYFWYKHKPILENFLSKQWNTQVTIGDTSISYNMITLQDVSVVQVNRQMIAKFNKIEAKFSIWQVFLHSIEIERLDILGVKLFLRLYTTKEENSLSEFFKNLPQNKGKVFSFKDINIYSIEFEAYDANGKSFEIWPIAFIDMEGRIPPKQTLGSLTKILLKEIEKKMISSHPLPFNAPISHQVLP